MKRNGKIVPVMLQTCEPEDLHLGLLPIQYIDFRNESEPALERLLAVWGLDKASRIKRLCADAEGFVAKREWASAVEKLEAALRVDPTHPQALADLERVKRQEYLASIYEKAKTALQEKRWRDGLDTLQQLIELDGDYKDVVALLALADAGVAREEAELLFDRGLTAAKGEDWVNAVESFQAALRITPSHELAQSELAAAQRQKELAELYADGRAHLVAGRWADALKQFRRVRSIDRNYKEVSEHIADADSALAEEDQRSKEDLLKRENERLETQQPRVKNGQAAKVRPAYIPKVSPAKRVETWPPPWVKAHPVITFGLIVVMSMLLVAASMLFADLVLDARASRHNFKGDELHKQGKYGEAEVAYRQAVEMSSDDADYYSDLGNALWWQRKYGEAEIAYRQAIKINPGDARYHSYLGSTLLQQQKYSEAEVEQRKAIDLDSGNAWYHDRLGVNLRIQKKYPEAEASCRKAVELYPQYSAYHNNLANVLDDQRKYAEAEAEYRKAVELTPKEPAYHYSLGINLSTQNKYTDAEAAFRKAIELNPNNAAYHFTLARNLGYQNKREEQTAVYRKVLEIDPNHEGAKRALNIK